MTAEITMHQAWREGTLGDIVSLLDGNKPYTYTLSQGMDKHHYFLSYVSASGQVKHKNVRILFSQGEWVWKNGSNPTYESIADLIPECLGCSENVCKPLRS